jgi:hypothetical protein
MLVLRKPRTEQPQNWAGIDWSNPITLGLQALFDARNAVEVISGDLATNRSSLAQPGPQGFAGDFSSTANQQYAHRAAYTVLDDLTIVAVCDVRSLTNYGALIAKQNLTTAYAPYELRLGAVGPTDSQLLLLRANGGTFAGVGTGANRLSVPFSGVLSVSVLANISTPQFYVSGVPFTGTGTVTTATDLGAAVWIGRRYDGATQLDGRIYYVALFNRVLSAAEHASLAQNPWQLFEPQQIRIPLQMAVTAYYPGTETAAAGWTASTGGSLSSCISETVASDADYIISPDVTTSITFAWAPASLPIGTWGINWHGMKTGTTGQIRIVLLDGGGTVLATGSYHAQTGAFANYTDTLTIASASTHFRIEDAP